MKTLLKRSLSGILTAMLVVTMIFSTVTLTSAATGISYTFSKSDAGYAEGTISLTASAGKYDLYWADNTKALDGFSSIATLSFSQSTTQTYTMPKQTAIPENAAKVIAVKSGNVETTNKIYFINNVGWSSVYCHAYESANTANKNASWPGVKMTYVEKDTSGYDVYSIELDQSFDEMQFDNGSSGNKNQTVDITIGSKNAYTVSDTASTTKYNVTNLSYGDEAFSESSLFVADAQAVYDIPSSKITTGKKLYTFANYSDIQLDCSTSSYPYSIQNWNNALEFASAQGADFMVTAGDNVNSSSTSGQKLEWDVFEKTLADSSYCNPVYEAVGNHELWPGVAGGTSTFVQNSGVDNSAETIAQNKSYYEVTENGDHYIFMALEGGFYPDRVEEFSDEQLDWVEGLIKKYSGDGHNIFVIEHSPFKSYGAGDNIDKPYYDIPLSDAQSSTVRLKGIFEKYKDVIFISGHTHIALAEQYNYSDNNGTSCQMIHDSSVGGSRTIVNGALNKNYSQSRSEGYIVDVYEDKLVFKGANLYYGQYLPSCTYIVKTSASIAGVQPATTSPVATTTAPQPTTTVPVVTTTAPQPTTTVPVVTTTAPQPTTTVPVVTTVPPTTEPEPEYICGDVDGDNSVTIKDATRLQQYLVGRRQFTEIQKKAADTDGSQDVSISDVTVLQSYIAERYTSLPHYKTQTVVPVKKAIEEKYQLLNDVGVDLNTKYPYASYNQYMSLKKLYRAISNGTVSYTQQVFEELSALYKNFTDIAGTSISTPPQGEIVVCFENSANWVTPYVYMWSTSTGANNVWPGVAMTKVDDFGSMYYVKIDYTKYQNIVFSNSMGTQTVDIELDGNGNTIYKLAELSNGKYNVKSEKIIA